jgi:hypothetical protein
MRDTAYAFAQAVDQQIDALSKEEFFFRRGRSKQLLEELFPISRLGLHFAFPGLVVEVEAFENVGPVDGHIYMSGYKTKDFDVEVTYLRTHEDSMRGELLNAEGFSPGAGSIVRDKPTGKIIANYGSLDHDEHIDALASNLFDLYAKKRAKTYPVGTVLLIAFDEVAFYGNTDWRKLFENLSSLGGITAIPFRGVYLFNCGTNELQSAA